MPKTKTRLTQKTKRVKKIFHKIMVKENPLRLSDLKGLNKAQASDHSSTSSKK